MSYKTLMLFTLALPLHSFASTHGDNTKMNVRDRSSKELTADQQTYNSTDTDITRRIRQDLVSEDSFSVYAQNVKIITLNGKVTIKGPVRSAQEQTTIMKYARLAAGPLNVIDEMSVVADTK